MVASIRNVQNSREVIGEELEEERTGSDLRALCERLHRILKVQGVVNRTSHAECLTIKLESSVGAHYRREAL